MGRTTLPIQGLYKQVIFSAFEAATKGNKVQVIGIAIPNPIKTDVINSMAYAINILGFSFLVVDDNEWQKIICSAYEQSEFENIPS
jgi:tetrahydromethanopterin S-methyltransferase subunit C